MRITYNSHWTAAWPMIVVKIGLALHNRENETGALRGTLYTLVHNIILHVSNADIFILWSRSTAINSFSDLSLGTPNFTPFGEFMISPIHYIHVYITEFVIEWTTSMD